MPFHLDPDKLVELDQAAALISDGAVVALGGGLSARLPMALVRELLLPVRGVKGSDIRRLHPEYGEVICPFTGETLVAVPPLRPDVTLLHAPLGDRRGNLHLDQPYVLDERFATASRHVVATVDRVASTDEVAAAGIT